jgi:hypothetical protein
MSFFNRRTPPTTRYEAFDTVECIQGCVMSPPCGKTLRHLALDWSQGVQSSSRKVVRFATRTPTVLQASIRAMCYAWPTYSTPQSTFHTALPTQDSHTKRRNGRGCYLVSELLWCTATEVPSLEAPPLLLV